MTASYSGVWGEIRCSKLQAAYNNDDDDSSVCDADNSHVRIQGLNTVEGLHPRSKDCLSLSKITSVCV